MPQREARVVALAGIVQAARLVRDLATRGDADAAIADPCLESIFRIDAESTADVFGGVSGVRLGLEQLIAQLDAGERDLMLTQLVLSILRVADGLGRDGAMRERLREGIEAIDRERRREGAVVADAAVQARLAELYVATLSTLRPRIVVHGDPQRLGNPRVVERIRAMLLAAVRAAVLWRQVGGGRFRLVLRRREYAMLARGLLARCTLDRG